MGFKSCPRVGGILECQCWRWRPTMFQVVPPCGGHLKKYTNGELVEMFQVVPPCGGHLQNSSTDPSDCSVSSRAPVWGASSFPQIVTVPMLSFKSCPRVGGILGSAPSPGPRHRFQVVPPCGGHPSRTTGKRPLLSFKSCPRVGGILCPKKGL